MDEHDSNLARDAGPGAAGRRDPRTAIKLDDAFVATFLTAPLANLILRRIESTSVTPNQVTVLSLAVTLVAAALFATAWWPALVLGAVLLLAGFVFDCLDGQLARHRGLATSFGAWLDLTCNALQEVALIAGIAWGVHRTTGGVAVFLWGYAATAVLLYHHLDNLLRARFLGGRYVDLLQGRSRPVDDPVKRAVIEEARSAGLERWGPFGRLLDALAPKGALGASRPVFWMKRALYFTGGERYLVISCLAVADRLDLALPLYTMWGAVVYPLITARRWLVFGGQE